MSYMSSHHLSSFLLLFLSFLRLKSRPLHPRGSSPTSSSHLAYDAVLHVRFLVAALFAHERDLQLTEGLGQDVALGEELPPLYDVGLQQRRVILVAQHPLPWQQMQAKCQMMQVNR